MAVARIFVLATVFAVLFEVVSCSGVKLLAKRKHESAADVGGRSRRNVNNNDAVKIPAEIEEMHIESRTSYRYTEVLILGTVSNNHMESREASFVLQIPESAFISNFSMFINGSWLFAQVLEKEEADKVYKEAQDKGESAGLVSSNPEIPAPRGMENYPININVAAWSQVELRLTYTEVLERKFGVYSQHIGIQPGQIVKHLTLKAELYEPQGFNSFNFTPPGEIRALESSRVPDLTLDASDTQKRVFYNMSMAAQASLDEKLGSKGTFVIQYDVKQNQIQSTGGTILTDGEYFVHYIAISDPSLTPLNKNFVFVIDVSGSMGGDKIKQTRDAMHAIIPRLNSDDYFNILLFSSGVREWKSAPVQATAQNKDEASAYVTREVIAEGGTNMEAGLTRAIDKFQLLTENIVQENGRMIIFLTDGDPTAGETNPDKLINLVFRKNTDMRIPIFSLAFGESVSFKFLEKLSYRNYGKAIQIYEAKDAASQLETFFAEVEKIILKNLIVEYDPLAVEVSTLTKTGFSQFFAGTEVVVAGRLTPSPPQTWTAQVTGQNKLNVVSYDIPVSSQNVYQVSAAPWSSGFIEKLRAYFYVKHLLQMMDNEEDAAVKKSFKDEAVEVSLQYNFVTPVTSMVITQSQSESDRRLEADLAGKGNYPMSGLAGAAGFGKTSLFSPLVIAVCLVHGLIFYVKN